MLAGWTARHPQQKQIRLSWRDGGSRFSQLERLAAYAPGTEPDRAVANLTQVECESFCRDLKISRPTEPAVKRLGRSVAHPVILARWITSGFTYPHRL